MNATRNPALRRDKLLLCGAKRRFESPSPYAVSHFSEGCLHSVVWFGGPLEGGRWVPMGPAGAGGGHCGAVLWDVSPGDI